MTQEFMPEAFSISCTFDESWDIRDHSSEVRAQIWFKSGELIIPYFCFSICKGIQQTRFAGVGISDDRSQRPLRPLTSGTLRRPLAADHFQFTRNTGNAILDPATVCFQLGFTVTSHPDAAFLAR
jgi:hypothetical protein